MLDYLKNLFAPKALPVVTGQGKLLARQVSLNDNATLAELMPTDRLEIMGADGCGMSLWLSMIVRKARQEGIPVLLLNRHSGDADFYVELEDDPGFTMVTLPWINLWNGDFQNWMSEFVDRACLFSLETDGIVIFDKLPFEGSEGYFTQNQRYRLVRACKRTVVCGFRFHALAPMTTTFAMGRDPGSSGSEARFDFGEFVISTPTSFMTSMDFQAPKIVRNNAACHIQDDSRAS